MRYPKNNNILHRILFSAILLGVFIIFSGCNNDLATKSQQGLGQENLLPQITQEEAYDKAIAYYPEGVELRFIGENKIMDETNQEGFVEQDCYLFDVVYDEKLVSGIAVGAEDKSIWFRDMNSDKLWLSESFMDYPKEDLDNDVVREPVIDISNNKTDGITVLYFAHINGIPELSAKNEGTVIWDEETKALSIIATKVTGTVTGAPDGPSFTLDVTWDGEKQKIESIDFRPAPVYSQPTLVLQSGEEMTIDSERLLEIAEYFKGLINADIPIKEATAPTPSLVMEQAWQDAYAGFLRENIPTTEVDVDAFVDGSEEEMRFDAFSSGGYPVTPFFYLYDINSDGIPVLIYIDATTGYDGDVYAYENKSISKIGSIRFYPFGSIGIPIDKTEGLYSDIGYKGNYGEIYLYTMDNGILTERMVLEYNNQSEQSPFRPGLPYSFDNFASIDYYEVNEINIEKVIYGK